MTGLQAYGIDSKLTMECCVVSWLQFGNHVGLHVEC